MFKNPENRLLMKQFNRYLILKDELGSRNDYCMLIRDSMLYDHQNIKNLKGAGFIYSMWSGYKKQEKMKHILDYAKLNNMEIIDLHTSGHASVDSLQRIIYSSEPKKLIPVHTENPDLFAEKFEKVYIAKDGQRISI